MKTDLVMRCATSRSLPLHFLVFIIYAGFFILPLLLLFSIVGVFFPFDAFLVSTPIAFVVLKYLKRYKFPIWMMIEGDYLLCGGSSSSIKFSRGEILDFKFHDKFPMLELCMDGQSVYIFGCREASFKIIYNFWKRDVIYDI